MKKRLLIILILFSILFSTFAVVQEFKPRIWAFNGEQNISIDLSKTFYLPKYSTIWNSTPSLENGTYKTKIETGGNGIGIIFKKGQIVKKVKEEELVTQLVKEIEKM